MVRFPPAVALLQNAGMGTEAGQKNQRIASDLFVTVNSSELSVSSGQRSSVGFSLRAVQSAMSESQRRVCTCAHVSRC